MSVTRVYKDQGLMRAPSTAAVASLPFRSVQGQHYSPAAYASRPSATPNISKQLFLKSFHERVTGYKPGTGTGTASRAVGEARGQEKPIIIYLPDYPNMLVSTVLAGDVRTEKGTESRRGTIASSPRLVEQGATSHTCDTISCRNA